LPRRFPRPVVSLPAALLLACIASTIAAQVPTEPGPLPAEVREAALDFLNLPETFRLLGDATIPAGTIVDGDVGLPGGRLVVRGAVLGRIVVLNGDLLLEAGSRVDGDILVIGGEAFIDPGAETAGDISVHEHPLRYRTRNGRLEAIPEEAFAPGFLAEDLGFGQARFTLRAGPVYNRVEGLPVRFGPIIQTAGSNPLSLEAFGIWKSVSGLNLDSDRLGYSFRTQQGMGGRGTVHIGASAFREVSAVEDRGMMPAEASLSTFLLRRDLRDYFEREGWSVFLNLNPARVPVRLELQYREEDHRTATIANPWTIRSSDISWRPLPLMGEGRPRNVMADLIWDTTNEPASPSDGWRITLGLGRQLGGTLQLPEFQSGETPGDGVSFPGAEFSHLTHGSLDVRRYARVGPTSRLNMRVLASGGLGGSPLPPQYQSSLGGEGSLPGHPRFSIDCGARDSIHHRQPESFLPDADAPLAYHAYGCDRTVLLQAEYQGTLPLSWNPVPEEWEDSEMSAFFDLRPTWAFFLNAGRGWSQGAVIPGLERPDSPTRADVGFGIFVGPLGLYWAYPLNERDQGLNFFVRLQQRF